MSNVWFITGSSRGLGRALTRAALQAGHRVAATARNPAQLADLVQEYGNRIHPLRLDVTDPTAAVSTLAGARAEFGRVDVVVNNAGYANVAPIETGDDGDFRAQFETNFWGVYNVSKAAIPVLRKQGGGSIIQISSMGGRIGGHRFLSGGQVRHRWLQPCPRRRNRAVRHQGDGGGTQWHRHGLGRFVDADGQHPRPVRRNSRRWAALGRSVDFDEPYPVGLPDE